MSKGTSPDYVPPSAGHPLIVVLYPTSFAGVIILTVTQLLLYVILLGFTPPRSLLRPAAIPLLTFLLWNLYQTCYPGVPLDILNAMIGGFASGWWVQYIVSALILQENYPTAPSSAPQNTTPKRSPAKKDTFWNRTWYGLKKINSQRNLGTEQEAKKIPHFSTSDPSYVPSRRAFLVQKGATIITCYLLLDLLTLIPPDVSSNTTAFSAEKVRFLSRITELSGEEVKTRSMASIGQWMASYIFLTMAHSALAFATVLLRFYEPRDWRPLFGSITELYSVRRFWGTFWHQMMRHKLQTAADVLTPPTLSLFSFLPLIPLFSSLSSQQRILKRYASIFWTFWASGVCHIMMDLWTQISWSETRAMKFFCIQVLGIILEDALQEAWRRRYLGPQSQGEKGGDGEEEEKNIWWGRVWKVVGLGWTIAWLVYTTPIWIYPGLRRAQVGPKGGLLPFSILKSAFRQG